MNSFHLSERELQEAAEAAAGLPATQAGHVRHCRLCQRRVATYQQVYSAAASQPPPVFSFDLAASVLAQLPRARPAFSWVLAGVGALVLGMVGAFAVLFAGVLLPALQGLFTGLGAGLAAVASLLVAGQCLELLVRHRRQMRLLTFS